MSRSLYKIPFVHKSITKKCLGNKKYKKIKISESQKLKNIAHYLYFWKRSSIINKNLLDKKIAIYNGKIFISLTVNKNHIGFYLGQFCVSRKTPAHRGKQKQNKTAKKIPVIQKRLFKPAKKMARNAVRIFRGNRYEKSRSKRKGRR